MTGVDWFAISIGGALILFGVLVTIFRAKLVNFISNEQRENFGAVGDKVAKAAKPSALVPVGVAGIVVGAIGITLGIVR